MASHETKVYILHGWTYTLAAWDRLGDLLREGGFDPVFLRVPGLTAPTDHAWTLDGYVEWLKGELPPEPAAIVGHSNGGRIAIEFAARYPERVSRLVLIDAAGIVHDEPLLRMRRKAFGWLARIGRAFVSSPFVRKAFYRMIGARDYGRAPEHMRETMRNLISVDLADRLALVRAPALIIWGAEDRATPLSDGMLMHRSMAGSKLVVIADAGHSPHQSHPEAVSQDIGRFLGRN